MTWAFSRQLVAWHRPFCVDLEESTFTYLRNFLESYCDGIESDAPPAPFLSKRYEANKPSVLIILYNLLWDHVFYCFCFFTAEWLTEQCSLCRGELIASPRTGGRMDSHTFPLPLTSNAVCMCYSGTTTSFFCCAWSCCPSTCPWPTLGALVQWFWGLRAGLSETCSLGS